MKELLWIACALLALEWIEDATRDAHPLMIDAAADSMCDVPFKRRLPLLSPDQTFPNAVRPSKDKGVA